MKSLLLLIFCSIVVYAAQDMKMTASLFAAHLEQLQKDKEAVLNSYKQEIQRFESIKITNHSITTIPQIEHRLDTLTHIDLSHGNLEGTNVITNLLKLAPNLRACVLTHNNITSLCEGEISVNFPFSYYLKTLDCSHNKITAVDFVELRKKLPNLEDFNLSGCPVTEFTVANFKPTSVITTIDLRSTDLSDTQKKEILRNSCVPDFQKDGNVCSTIVGATVLLGISLPSIVLSVCFLPASLSVVGYTGIVFIEAVGAVSLPFGSMYLADLGSTPPEKRFKTLYYPLLDHAEYSEKEITTAYGRFVKRFPYLFAKSKGFLYE